MNENVIIPIEYQINAPTIDYMNAMGRLKYANDNEKIKKNQKIYFKNKLFAMILPMKIYKDGNGYFIDKDDLNDWDDEIYKNKLLVENYKIKLNLMKSK